MSSTDPPIGGEFSTRIIFRDKLQEPQRSKKNEHKDNEVNFEESRTVND